MSLNIGSLVEPTEAFQWSESTNTQNPSSASDLRNAQEHVACIHQVVKVQMMTNTQAAVQRHTWSNQLTQRACAADACIYSAHYSVP